MGCCLCDDLVYTSSDKAIGDSGGFGWLFNSRTRSDFLHVLAIFSACDDHRHGIFLDNENLLLTARLGLLRHFTFTVHARRSARSRKSFTDLFASYQTFGLRLCLRTMDDMVSMSLARQLVNWKA